MIGIDAGPDAGPLLQGTKRLRPGRRMTKELGLVPVGVVHEPSMI